MTSHHWIFLRGLTRGNIHWGNFPEIFKGLNPDVEMEFLELPGNGYLSEEKSSTNSKEIIDGLISRSEFCKNNLTYHICGISLGGMVALKWAELYPQNVQSVAIINSSLSQCSPFYCRLKITNYGKIILGLFNRNESEQERIILNITSNKLDETIKYLGLFAAFAKKHKISKANFLKQLLLANSIHIKKLPQIPLKIFSSKNDKLVHFSCSDQIAEEFGGLQYIHISAGHDLPLDEPEWLSEKLTFD